MLQERKKEQPAPFMARLTQIVFIEKLQYPTALHVLLLGLHHEVTEKY